MKIERVAAILAAFLVAQSCQLIWELNPLERLDNPILPASGEMAKWNLEEFSARMVSTRWTAAVVNHQTLGPELVTRLQYFQASPSTRVKASLLLIDAMSRVEGVPHTVSIVMTRLFPQAYPSGLFDGFTPATDALTLHNLMTTFFGSGTPEQRTRILNILLGVHYTCGQFLSNNPPDGTNWFATATLEELGQVVQVSVGAAFVFALMSNTSGLPFDSDRVIAYLDSSGDAAALATNFDGANLATAFQAIFDGLHKVATTSNAYYVHLDSIGNALPF